MNVFHGVSITKKDVESLKGVDEALKNYYTEAVSSAAHRSGLSEREVRDWIGSALITQGFRSAVTEGPTSGDAGSEVLDELESVHHLIRSESRASRTWYELSHDRLVDPIVEDNERVDRSLAPWLREAKKWADEAPESGLLTGSLLVDAERWLEEHPDAQLLPREQEFLDASRTENLRVAAIVAAAARDRRRALVSYGLALLAVLLLAGAVVAAFWATDAQQQADAALAERERAQDGLVQQTDLAEAAAVEAAEEADKARAAEQLAQQEADKARAAEQLAQQEADNARAAEQLAQQEADNARAAEQLAQQEADNARAAEQLAQDEQQKADQARAAEELQRVEAESQTAIAEAQRAEAESQTAIAEAQRAEAERQKGIADQALLKSQEAQEELGDAFDVLATEVVQNEYCNFDCPTKDAQWKRPDICSQINNSDLRTQVRVDEFGSLIYLGTLVLPTYWLEPDLPTTVNISVIGPDGRRSFVNLRTYQLPDGPLEVEVLDGFVYIFESLDDGSCVGGIISDLVDFSDAPLVTPTP